MENNEEVYFVDSVEDWPPGRSRLVMLRMPAAVAEEIRNELKKVERIKRSPKYRKAASADDITVRVGFYRTAVGREIEEAHRRIAELRHSVGYNYTYRNMPNAHMLLYQVIPVSRDPSWTPLVTDKALGYAAS